MPRTFLGLTLEKAQELKAALDKKYGPIAEYVTFDIATPPNSDAKILFYLHEDTLMDFIQEIAQDMKAIAGPKVMFQPNLCLRTEHKIMNDKTMTVKDLIEKGKRKIFMRAVKEAETTDVAVPALPKIKMPRGPDR